MMNSTLTPEEKELFYEIWNPFYDYVRSFDQMTICFDRTDNEKIDFHSNIPRAWTEKINLYLKITELPQEHREIIESWKRAVSAEFVLERHLKKGSALISLQDQFVYVVKGIDVSWEQMFPKPSVMFQTTLLPFRDKIIYNGKILNAEPIIGHCNAGIFKSLYTFAKQAKLIKTSL